MQSNSQSTKTRKSPSSSSSSSLVENYRLNRAILVGRRAGPKMDLRSPSRATKNIGRDKGKEARMSSRRLASGEIFEADSGHNSPLSSKDGSKLPEHHRRRSSNLSQKLQLIEYLEQEQDMVSFEAKTTTSIKTRLKDISGALAGSKEMIKAVYRLLSQEGQNKSSRLTLVSAIRVEIDRARHEIEELIDEESFHNEKDIKSLLKGFAAEKVVWKRREQDRIIDAISSVSKELEIEKKLRRQSERLSKRLGKELADTKEELSKATKKLECERRAREVLEQTYDELVCSIGKENGEVEELKWEEEAEMEEKNEALERLRSDLEVYLGGKQLGFEKRQSGSCQNEKMSEREEDLDDTELKSIELSMDSFSKSYTWSSVKEDESVEEVFKGRRSLSEKIQWGDICLQRKTSNCNPKPGNGNGFDKGRLEQVCAQDERSVDHNKVRGLFGGRAKKDAKFGS